MMYQKEHWRGIWETTHKLHHWQSNFYPWLWLPAFSKLPEDNDFSEDTEQERETHWKRDTRTQDELHKGKLDLKG